MRSETRAALLILAGLVAGCPSSTPRSSGHRPEIVIRSAPSASSRPLPPATLQLTLTTTLERAPAHARLAFVSQALAVSDGISVVLYEPSTGKALADRSAAPSSPDRIVIQQELSPVGNVLLGTDHQQILAQSLQSGEILWRRDAAPPGCVLSSPSQILPVGKDVLFNLSTYAEDNAICKSLGTEIVALTLDQGTIRWRRQLLAKQLTSGHGRVIAQSYEGNVTAIDADDGHTLWAHPAPKDLIIEGSAAHSGPLAWGDVVLVGGQGPTLQLLDGATGSLLSTIPLPGITSGDLLYAGDGSAYVYVREKAGEEDSWGQLLAIDLSTRAIGWRGPRLRTVNTWRPSIAVGAKELYLCECGVLRDLDRTTGKVLWSWSVDKCDNLALSADSSTLAVSSSAYHKPSVQIFTKGTKAPDIRKSHVHGQVTFNGKIWPFAEVRIGPAHVRADDQGRYQAVVHIAGVLTSEVFGPPPGGPLSPNEQMQHAGPPLVLDGRSTPYSLDLALLSVVPIP